MYVLHILMIFRYAGYICLALIIGQAGGLDGLPGWQIKISQFFTAVNMVRYCTYQVIINLIACEHSQHYILQYTFYMQPCLIVQGSWILSILLC